MGGDDSQKLTALEGNDTPLRGAATSGSLRNQHSKSKAICSGVGCAREESPKKIVQTGFYRSTTNQTQGSNHGPPIHINSFAAC
jgi:hypothetical protein